MNNPDVSSYVDLTLYDADPTVLVNRMMLNTQQVLPGWKPQAGLPEVTVAQGLALIISELVFAVNRLPGATVQTLLQLFGITRSTGTAATATVTFTATGSTAASIPAGTELQLQLGSQAYVFTTNTATAIAAGVTSATAQVTCATNTAAVNGAAAGTPLTVLATLPFVNGATIATSPAGGIDPETSAAWLSRGTQTLQSISSALTLPAQFVNAALADTADGVYRAHATNNWDPTLAGGAGGYAQGAITVSVMGRGGALLTNTQKSKVQALLAARALAGLAVHVADPTVTTVNVQATVWQSPGWTPSQVQANIAAQLAAPRTSASGGGPGGSLSTDLWDFTQGTVRLNDLITVITETPGVAYVVNVTTPTADIPLPGIAPLAALGTVSITIEGP